MEERKSPHKTFHDMRPKTAISRKEAVNYSSEGVEDPDFNPTIDIFYTTEVLEEKTDDGTMINEFLLGDTIGKGSYSKVKLVKRIFMEDGEEKEEKFGMKVLHKGTLKRDRCAIYLPGGEFEMSNSLEKVYMEIDLWSQLNHPNIVRLYEMIDAEAHDYIYLVMEYCEKGQIAKWDFEKEKYFRN